MKVTALFLVFFFNVGAARAEMPSDQAAAANPQNFGQCRYACGVNAQTLGALNTCIAACDRFNNGLSVPAASAPEATVSLPPVNNDPTEVSYAQP